VNRKADFFTERIDSNRFESRIGMLYWSIDYTFISGEVPYRFNFTIETLPVRAERPGAKGTRVTKLAQSSVGTRVMALLDAADSAIWSPSL